MNTPQHSSKLEPLEGALKDAVDAIRESSPPPGFGARVFAEATTWKHPVTPRSYEPPARSPLIALIGSSIAASVFFLWFTGDHGSRREEIATGKPFKLESRQRDKSAFHDAEDDSASIKSLTSDRPVQIEFSKEGEIDNTKEDARNFFKESGATQLPLNKDHPPVMDSIEALSKSVNEESAGAPKPGHLERDKENTSPPPRPQEEFTDQPDRGVKGAQTRKQTRSSDPEPGRGAVNNPQSDDKLSPEPLDTLMEKADLRFSRGSQDGGGPGGASSKKLNRQSNATERSFAPADKAPLPTTPAAKPDAGDSTDRAGVQSLGAIDESKPRANTAKNSPAPLTSEKAGAGLGGFGGFGGGDRSMRRAPAANSLNDMPAAPGEPEAKKESREGRADTARKRSLEQKSADAQSSTATGRSKFKGDLADRIVLPNEETQTEAKSESSSPKAESATPLLLAPTRPAAPKMPSDETPDAAQPGAPGAVADAPAEESLSRSEEGNSENRTRFGAAMSVEARESKEVVRRHIAVADDATLLFTTGPARSVRLGEVVPETNAHLLHVIDWSKDEQSRILTEIGAAPLSAVASGKALLNANGVFYALLDKRVDRFDGLGDHIQALAISPTGKEVVTQHWDDTGDQGGYLRISSLPSGEKRFDVTGAWSRSFAVGFSPQGDAFAAMDKDRLIHEYKIADGAEVKSFEPPLAEGVRAIEYSPDGTMIASTSTHGETRVWNRETAQVLHELKRESAAPEGEDAALTAMRFSPDSKFLAAATASNLFFWNVATGKVAGQVEPSAGGAIYLRYAPDGKSITAISNFERAALESGRPGVRYPTVRTFEVPESARQAESSP